MDKKTLEEKFKENLEAFQEQLPRLLIHNEGKYGVGIKGDEFECWDTYRDALQYGYKKYGYKEPFIVKQVLRFERPERINSFSVQAA